MPKKKNTPKLRQRKNGSFYVQYYDPTKSPARKQVYIGVTHDEQLDNPQEDAPDYVLTQFWQEYFYPYMRGAYDPWNPDDGRAEGKPFLEAAEEFWTREGVSDNTNRTNRLTLSEFGSDYLPEGTSTRQVKTADVRSYILRDDISDSYKTSIYSRLNAAFNWFVDQGYLLEDENPMKDVKRPKTVSKSKTYLTPWEIERLRDAMMSDYRERCLNGTDKGCKPTEIIWAVGPLMFGVATGMRPSEIQRLKVGDVNLDTGQIIVRSRDGQTTKTGQERSVPMCQLAEDIFEQERYRKDPDDYLFVGARADQFDTRRLSRVVKSYIKGAKDVNSEADLYAATRHTCASWLAMMGYPAMTIAGLLGHSGTRITENYMHLAPSMLQRGMKDRYQKFAAKAESLGFFKSMLQFAE